MARISSSTGRRGVLVICWACERFLARVRLNRVLRITWLYVGSSRRGRMNVRTALTDGVSGKVAIRESTSVLAMFGELDYVC